MEQLNQLLQKQFAKMCKTGKLYRVVLSGLQVWDLYLKSFTKENDPMFRDPQSSVHNCNYCNNFIRRYGNIVSIDENFKLTSIFDVVPDEEYLASIIAMSTAIKASPIKDVFFESFLELKVMGFEKDLKPNNTLFQIGVDKNIKRYTAEEAALYGVVKPNEIRVFNHMHLFVPQQFVNTNGGVSVDAIMASYRDAKNVFQRAMEEIPLSTLKLVKDLIVQGSLLDGQTHLYKIEQIIPYKEQYDALLQKQKDNWCWQTAYGLSFAKFKNELIGVLCTELAEGLDLNIACQNWNKRVDPANYMKAVAPFTENQKKEAAKFIVENGFEQSFSRRVATIDDIKVSEILHSNVGDGKIKEVSILDGLKSVSSQHKRAEFDGIEEVSIEKFMKDILPGCTSVEAFLVNEHEGNFVTLTTPEQPDSKPIFKWDNNYSWSYKGNLAGKSQIKEAVKSAGGNIQGILRSSVLWNEEGSDGSDLDLWCVQPNNEKIGFNTPFRKDRGGHFSSCNGQLDLDKRVPGGQIAVENIYFPTDKKLIPGAYSFYVHQYSARNSKGFKAEIDIAGEVYNYEYPRPVKGSVPIATVIYKDGKFEIKHSLPCTNIAKEIYGLESNKFHKVNLVCLSPNHWGENNIGNKHYFFMLDKCVASEPVRGFHSENLIPELADHRKVLEVLGATTSVKVVPKELSGLGFNATVKDELIVRLSGNFKRVIKIKFA